MTPFVPKPDKEGINYQEKSSLGEFVRLLLSTVFVASLVIVLLGLGGEYLLLWFGAPLERYVFASKSFSALEGKNFSEGQAVLQKLIGEEAKSFSITVICDEDPNAFAIPGYTIGITSGTLANLKSEEGLAFVLGHEYGHFEHRDHLRGLGFGLGVLFATSLVGLEEIGSSITSLSQTLISRRFTKSQERAADETAIRLMKQSYGSLAGATEFFEHVQKESPDSRLDTFFSTHPLTKERIGRIQSAAAAEKTSRLSPLGVNIKEYCP